MTAPTPTTAGGPRRLGSAYVLTSLIGAGAQGEVWLGRRVDGSAADLAVKLLRADLLQDPGVIERFVRERATLMRVRSPYVVGIQDMVVEGDTAAIVMDYVGGGDLRRLLESRGTLRPEEVARIGALLAEGLAVVHGAGIVHRDVKPANVLIDVVDGSGLNGATSVGGAPTRALDPQAAAWIPRLADFGVARICSTVASSRATGAIGTPLYMAPEILDVHAPTPAADVYSLGVVLYEAACGAPPFVGVPSQVLGQHARRAPGRPQGIPDALWGTIDGMLAKQPAARPGAPEAARALAALAPRLAGLPAAPRVQEPPPSTPSAMPYVWNEEPTASEQDGSPAAETPTTVADQYAPTLLAPSSPTGATAPPTAVASPAPSTAPDASPPDAATAVAASPRRRRRPLIVAGIATVIVIALVLAAGGLFLWQRHRRQAALAGTIASLPAKAKVVELRRIGNVYDYLPSPGGGALAVESSGDWSLYDLDSTDQAPVWTGSCDKPRFWNDTTLLCRDSDAATLVSLDGSTTTDVPGPVDHRLVGSDGERAILIDGESQGSLVALDEKGKESWRAGGHYSKARVRNGFVIAYDGRSKSLQVLSAATGNVLYSQPADTDPDFTGSRSGARDPGPADKAFEVGGINIGAGTRAFVVRGGSAATVYDSEGNRITDISSAASGNPAWAMSASRDAKDFAADLSKVEGASNTVAVVGTDASVPVAVDTDACEATRSDKDGVSFVPPAPTDGEACVITPKGLIGGDSAVLFDMGQPTSRSKATGANVVAYDVTTGEQLWQTAGTLVKALPPSGNAPGEASGQPRVLVRQGGNGSNGELVISAVVAD